MTKEILKQTLEAGLESDNPYIRQLAANAVRKARVQPVQEPTPWRDMVVVSLVREGINKHRARELADHFVNFTLPPPLPVQEPWGACVSGRVFVGALPEHVRKISEDEGAPIQWLYTTPPQRKPLTHMQSKELVDKYGYDLLKLVFQTEAAHGIKEQS